MLHSNAIITFIAFTLHHIHFKGSIHPNCKIFYLILHNYIYALALLVLCTTAGVVMNSCWATCCSNPHVHIQTRHTDCKCDNLRPLLMPQTLHYLKLPFLPHRNDHDWLVILYYFCQQAKA